MLERGSFKEQKPHIGGDPN